MKIKITGRETLIVSPGEIYVTPDNIALQLLKRGKAVEIKEEIEKPKKISKKE